MSSTNNAPSTESTTNPSSTESKNSRLEADENRWVTRFEELLKVKNLDALRGELAKIANEIQGEIQNFDINAHLSPEARNRLKTLEKRYNEVIRALQKAQKQFDREFQKSLRVLKRTRQDAEKHINNIKAKITKHRSTIVKASNQLKKKIKIKPKKKKTAKKTTRSTKATTAKAT